MTIKAIETRYAGCRFRSRLEARWAVFFDHLSVNWEYEPEGYTLGSGRRYLPDFWLPDRKTLVEVKGDADKLDLDLLTECLSIPEVYWVLILGPIPVMKEGAVPNHTTLHREADYRQFIKGPEVKRPDRLQVVTLISYVAFVGTGETFSFLPAAFPNLVSTPAEALNPLACDSFITDPAIATAYTAARSARFEHGESGAPATPTAPAQTQPDTLTWLRDRWIDIVGPDLGCHTEPADLKDGEVTIHVVSTSWATQVRLLASQLARRLNAELGTEAVRRVVVQRSSSPALARRSAEWRQTVRRAHTEEGAAEEQTSRNVKCQACGAEPRTGCRTTGPSRTPRKESHRVRYQEARTLGEPAQPEVLA